MLSNVLVRYHKRTSTACCTVNIQIVVLAGLQKNKYDH